MGRLKFGFIKARDGCAFIALCCDMTGGDSDTDSDTDSDSDTDTDPIEGDFATPFDSWTNVYTRAVPELRNECLSSSIPLTADTT